MLRASGVANPSRSAGGAAFRAPGTSRPLTTPGAPPHPADGGGKPGRASVRADGELRVDGISFADPGWTVFHLPSTPGLHGPSDRERAAGSDPAEPSGSVEWAGVRLNQLGLLYSRGPESEAKSFQRHGEPAPRRRRRRCGAGGEPAAVQAQQRGGEALAAAEGGEETKTLE